ncbi:MAG TPA: hypothetical protein PKI20_09255 [Verrucomicrobiota bacterium]|jgi:hypothetical protein|nr:hypothetical protein [Verrucomicrobiota bacterium]HQL77888.1 hypothetical protein [Verrucomicrobiota bacterium]
MRLSLSGLIGSSLIWHEDRLGLGHFKPAEFFGGQVVHEAEG